MRYKFKNIIITCLAIGLVLSTAGCGDNNQASEDATTISKQASEITSGADEQTDNSDSAPGEDQQAVAIYAGDVQVYIDEARYYLYTAQATYEVYYISEGSEIDWDGEMQDGVTWQQGVKSLVMDDICRRECMYALADEYDVSLNTDEAEEVEEDVEAFFKDSDEKLVYKIDISEERLEYVFEKKLIVEKVEEAMTAEYENLADETYEKWKEENAVTTEDKWEGVGFDEAIFTLEDVD